MYGRVWLVRAVLVRAAIDSSWRDPDGSLAILLGCEFCWPIFLLSICMQRLATTSAITRANRTNIESNKSLWAPCCTSTAAPPPITTMPVSALMKWMCLVRQVLTFLFVFVRWWKITRALASLRPYSALDSLCSSLTVPVSKHKRMLQWTLWKHSRNKLDFFFSYFF